MIQLSTGITRRLKASSPFTAVRIGLGNILSNGRGTGVRKKKQHRAGVVVRYRDSFEAFAFSTVFQSSYLIETVFFFFFKTVIHADEISQNSGVQSLRERRFDPAPASNRKRGQSPEERLQGLFSSRLSAQQSNFRPAPSPSFRGWRMWYCGFPRRHLKEEGTSVSDLIFLLF